MHSGDLQRTPRASLLNCGGTSRNAPIQLCTHKHSSVNRLVCENSSYQAYLNNLLELQDCVASQKAAQSNRRHHYPQLCTLIAPWKLQSSFTAKGTVNSGHATHQQSTKRPTPEACAPLRPHPPIPLQTLPRICTVNHTTHLPYIGIYVRHSTPKVLLDLGSSIRNDVTVACLQWISNTPVPSYISGYISIAFICNLLKVALELAVELAKSVSVAVVSKCLELYC